MWIGALAGLLLLFFVRLAFRRLHAQRSDQMLRPIVLCQDALLSAASSNNGNGTANNAATASDATTIPGANVFDLYDALRRAAAAPPDVVHGNAAALVSLPEAEKLLSASPTVAFSLGGQRAVWSRSPLLLRRVLHTHFRLFPGPPTRDIPGGARVEASSYRSSLLSTSVLLDELLSRRRPTALCLVASSSSSSRGSEASFALVDAATRMREAFPLLRDGARSWDHVTWQGGFKPGEVPDVPGLLLRGMAARRAAEGGNAPAPTATMTTDARDRVSIAALRSGADSVSPAARLTFAQLRAIATAVARRVARDVIGDAASATLERSQRAGASCFEVTLAGLAAALTPMAAAATGDTEAATAATTAAAVAGHGFAAARDALVCIGFALGLSPLSLPLSLVVDGHRSATPASVAFGSSDAAGAATTEGAITAAAAKPSLATALAKWTEDLRAAVDACADGAASILSPGATPGSATAAHFADPCGLKAVLQHCGASSFVTGKAADATQAAALRWDSLLRSVVADKAAVATAHLAAATVDVCVDVIAALSAAAPPSQRQPAIDFATLRDAVFFARSPPSSSGSPAVAAGDSPLTRDVVAMQACAREALRLRPPVARCVRAVETDDMQPAELFGIPAALVKRVTGFAAPPPPQPSATAPRQQQHQQRQKTPEEVVQETLDPSARGSMNGMLTTPSSACVVCDIAAMLRAPSVWNTALVRSEGSGGDSEDVEAAAAARFDPRRWAAVVAPETAALAALSTVTAPSISDQDGMRSRVGGAGGGDHADTAQSASQRQRMEASFGPFGFSAASDAAARYVVTVAAEVLLERVDF
jgi:hypothetical protein